MTYLTCAMTPFSVILADSTALKNSVQVICLSKSSSTPESREKISSLKFLHANWHLQIPFLQDSQPSITRLNSSFVITPFAFPFSFQSPISNWANAPAHLCASKRNKNITKVFAFFLEWHNTLAERVNSQIQLFPHFTHLVNKTVPVILFDVDRYPMSVLYNVCWLLVVSCTKT